MFVYESHEQVISEVRKQILRQLKLIDKELATSTPRSLTRANALGRRSAYYDVLTMTEDYVIQPGRNQQEQPK